MGGEGIKHAHSTRDKKQAQRELQIQDVCILGSLEEGRANTKIHLIRYPQKLYRHLKNKDVTLCAYAGSFIRQPQGNCQAASCD